MKMDFDRNRALGTLAGIGAGTEMAHPESLIVRAIGWVLIALFVLNFLYESISFEGGHVTTNFKKSFAALWPVPVILAAVFAISVAGAMFIGVYEGRAAGSSAQAYRDNGIFGGIIHAAELKREHLQGENDYRRIVIQGVDGSGGYKKMLSDLEIANKNLADRVNSLDGELWTAQHAPQRVSPSPAAPQHHTRPCAFGGHIGGKFSSSYSYYGDTDVTCPDSSIAGDATTTGDVHVNH